MFSDESRFNMTSDSGHQLLWREHGTRYAYKFVCERDGGAVGLDFPFMDDNAKPHRSVEVSNTLQTLQKVNEILIGYESVVSRFDDKLELHPNNQVKKQFHQFQEYHLEKDDATPKDIDRFSSHLNESKLDTEKRFEDILK
ncbi:hypothetical protein TNCV_4943041 [Trichonephila clavipes]|nr:hypothetical protein TNCV_4943041 [Trichonephila clavipes]